MIGIAVAALVVAVVIAVALSTGSSPGPGSTLATNPDLDPGTPLSGSAPDFTLTDQFGRPVSLHSFRGKVVILAFNDSECTTVCPLTTAAMLDAKAMLVSYPTYQMNPSALTAILPGGILGTPSTIFFNAAGKLVPVHTGQYESQGSLDADIHTYALHG